MIVLAVLAGAALGAVARYALTFLPALNTSDKDDAGPLIPWPTFAANVAACLILGIVVRAFSSSTELLGQSLTGFAALGFCGALSTMSTFALELVNLARSHSFVRSLGYLCLTLGTCFLAFWAGLVMAS